MVNAKHARPLAAYWLLALAAALITALGLGDRQAVQARHGSPVRVPSSAAPELVLGGVLHAQPNRTFPLSADLWAPHATPTPSGGTPSGEILPVNAPSTPSTMHKARTKSGGSQHTTTVRTHRSETAAATATAPATRGQGKGRHKSDQVAKTATTATATASTTKPKHGHGGHGGGRTDNRGKGH